MTELEELQNEVLRGIGRNVLNLQKIEGMLKFIESSTGVIASTTDVAELEESLNRSAKSRRKAVERMPMGRLVDAVSKTLASGEIGDAETEPDNGELKIEVSYSFEDPAFVTQLKRALSEVTRERNDLIHKRLISFRPSSIDSCKEMMDVLDKQRARIKPQFETLAAICANLLDFQKDFERYAKSESFINDLVSALNAQTTEEKEQE